MPHAQPLTHLYTKQTDEALAIKQISQQLPNSQHQLNLLFISNQYIPDKITQEIQTQITTPTIACSTAGEINIEGYQQNSISGVSFSGQNFQFDTFIIEDLNDFQREDSQKIKNDFDTIKQNHKNKMNNGHSFAILLIDGLSEKEELTTSILANALEETPLIGASSGDGFNFKSAHLFHNHKYSSNSAAIIIITTNKPFQTFKRQHFSPTDKKVVITESDPVRRIVKEINGEPAVQAYSKALGIDPKDFKPTTYSQYPLMLKMGNEYYVRSIKEIHKDQSLTFLCAIENGLVLTIAQPENFFENTEYLFKKLEEKVGGIDCCLLFECMLRRLEVFEKPPEEQKKIMNLYSKYKAFGFHTYGEQYNNLHVNQTLTGVAFGK